jgi:hypothetical protein
MSGLQRPRPAPNPSGDTDKPQYCPQCGGAELREVAQTAYVTYLSCEQCRYLLTVSKPSVEPPFK